MDDVPGCGDIGVAHAQIYDVFSPAACNLLEVIDNGEDVRGEPTDTMKVLSLLGDQAIPPKTILFDNPGPDGRIAHVRAPLGFIKILEHNR